MYSITFVILPVTKTIFCTRGCFSASLGLKMNIDSLSWPYGHLRLSNLSFPALVTLENNHSYQKLFPTLGKWQMNEVKYYCWKCGAKLLFICYTNIFWDILAINKRQQIRKQQVSKTTDVKKQQISENNIFQKTDLENNRFHKTTYFKRQISKTTD